MKYKNLLSNKFFRDNPTEQLSAQAIAQFEIRLNETELRNEVNKLVLTNVDMERKAKSEDEAQVLSAISNAQDAARFMRRSVDSLNKEILIQKLLDFEDEILPTVIQMLKTTGNTYFIENSTRFLSKCGNNPTEHLLQIFDEMRDAYAQSMIFIVLGFRADEDAIPWIYEKYFEFKKKDTADEKYSEGALLALYKLSERFGG